MRARVRRDLHEANRKSWNRATAAHNAHKPGQAEFLREGGELLFDEDYALLGELAGKRVLHLQCNSGQDTLCIARRGAEVLGVDISDEAITQARALSEQTGLEASFERADIYDWLPAAALEGRRFDLVYCSYGWLCWLSDLDAWARGIAAVLREGGALVLVEFHPFAMTHDEQGQRRYPYFGGAGGETMRFDDGVGDYVGESGESLAPGGFAPLEQPYQNPHPSHEFCWSVADLLAALVGAGLELERVHEWPFSNGYKMFESLEPMQEGDTRRYAIPAGEPSMPLQLGLRARKPEGLPMYRVDAFADRPFAGNPAAVCVVSRSLEPARMQAIAAENNLSETAFITARADGDYDIRWFTPTTEVPLCGHATLASSFVVLHELEPEREQVVFHSQSGPLTVSRGEGGRLKMLLPVDPPCSLESPEGLAEALGAIPSEVQRGAYWLARFESEEQVAGLSPDFAKLGAIPPGELIATAPASSDELDFVSRFFGPGVGIDEDPVTGSAHCILAPYWAERLGKARLRARQISARGGELECEVLGEQVELSGSCVLISRARLLG